jgi:hypothetical protein
MKTRQQVLVNENQPDEAKKNQYSELSQNVIGTGVGKQQLENKKQIENLYKKSEQAIEFKKNGMEPFLERETHAIVLK